MNDLAAQLAFCPVLAEIVRTGEAIGASGKRIPNWSMSTTSNLLTMRNLHLTLRPERTLETGLRFGGSALMFTQTHKDLGAEPARQHIAIDPYQRSPFNDSSGLLAIDRAQLMPFLDFREDFSSFVLPALLSAGESFSMIYLDGSHNLEDVFIDLYYSVQLLGMDGVVLFDDSTHPHLRKILKFVRRNLRHCLEPMDMCPFHPDKSLRYRAARALGRIQLTGFKKVGELARPHGYDLKNF